jgi:hypothetical protein
VKEFTLRNKTKQPIMTLTKPMLAKMLEAHPESVSMALAKQVKEYKSLTGKTLMLDHEQDLILRAHAGADERGWWTSKYNDLPYPLNHVKPVFSDGFMQRHSGSMLDDLALAEAFHNMLDLQLAALAPAPSPAAA